MSESPARMPALPALWILFCAYCNLAGWVLSALHQLNAVGYVAAFLPAAALLLWLRKRFFPARVPGSERSASRPGLAARPSAMSALSWFGSPVVLAAAASSGRLALRGWRKLKRRFAAAI